MPTIAEIQALIQKEVRQQRSHLVRNGLADILDMIAAGASDAASGGATIYSADGTLSGDRVVTLNGKKLNIQQGGNDFLFIDPTAGNETSTLQAYNTTDDNNTSAFIASTENDRAAFSATANFNLVKEARISGFTDATTSTITHTADTHTFVASGVGVPYLLLNDGNYGSELRAYDGGDGQAKIELKGNESGGDVYIKLNADSDGDIVNITLDAPTKTITHTADTHTMVAEGESNVLVAKGESQIRGFNSTSAGNESRARVTTSDTDAEVILSASFNNDTKLAKINALADATTSSITHTADRHIFLGTDNVFADNAAAVTGGLAVGTHYRTGDALKIVHA